MCVAVIPEPDGILIDSFWPVAMSLRCVPPTSITRMRIIQACRVQAWLLQAWDRKPRACTTGCREQAGSSAYQRIVPREIGDPRKIASIEHLRVHARSTALPDGDPGRPEG